jgi:hypothetical protein
VAAGVRCELAAFEDRQPEAPVKREAVPLGRHGLSPLYPRKNNDGPRRRPTKIDRNRAGLSVTPAALAASWRLSATDPILPPVCDAFAGDEDMELKQSISATRWATATDVLDRLAKVREARDIQSRLIAALNDKVRQREIELESSLGDLSDGQRLSVVSRATGSLRRELRTSTEADRNNLLREAVEHGDVSRGVATHYQSPIQMLMRESLGSERRSRVLQQIEHSGAAELASLAEYAAGTADSELAAALCSRNSTIKVSQRGFSSSALADRLFGEQHRIVTDALREIDVVSREIIQEDRALVAGKRNSIDKVQRGLDRRGEWRVNDGDDTRFPIEEIEE